ncbi:MULTISPECIES: PTS sugar transporter subunit IIA [unclassified Cellulomonas]|uniref:PTS sugar transporter subunit IIA n=1 Tax=unclassified Cellulomonas TaxID=2620175 RepID=UPI0019A3A971|nr:MULTISPECIES: PTS sugar transporter subunit IIA [unclassified Cellulomonas]MBD3779491.1 PTS sugar transporter subunit IIA [Micrococcales bacterium]QZN84363.1 PTS sugar transporter subunit IIA [Cellulomonas sp. C5510]WHP17660.1 PTS sugar transporter subunit IIA [Cellulomonas sp. ES6]
MNAVLSDDLIVPAGRATTKEEAIREAGGLLVASGAVEPEYVDAMLDRERTVSTYMGSHLAIPHGTEEAKGRIRRSAISLVRYEQPVDWDGNPVRVVVGIAGAGGEHLELLSRIALVFTDAERVQRVLDATTREALAGILAEVEPA